MNKPTVRIYTGNGEFIDREMNDNEFAQYEKDKVKFKAIQTEAETKAAAKAALLERLGITQEEAQLLLGGN
jgi:hypothetical protein